MLRGRIGFDSELCWARTRTQGLEGRYLDAWPLVDLAGKRVWAVGPVAAQHPFPDASVTYVSFGTMMAPPPPHVAPFVWAASTATLPDGFEASAAASGKGMVIRGWAVKSNFSKAVETVTFVALDWMLCLVVYSEYVSCTCF
jgi:hypothetical protein